MKKIILVGILILVGIAIGSFYRASKEPTPVQTPTSSPTATPAASANECQNPQLNLQPNQTVDWPINVVAIVDNRDPACRWVVFEAQAGTVEVRDRNNQIISQGVLSTTDEWMTEQPVEYLASLTLKNEPSSKEVELILTEENPRGEGDAKQLKIPLVLN